MSYSLCLSKVLGRDYFAKNLLGHIFGLVDTLWVYFPRSCQFIHGFVRSLGHLPDGPHPVYPLPATSPFYQAHSILVGDIMRELHHLFIFFKAPCSFGYSSTPFARRFNLLARSCVSLSRPRGTPGGPLTIRMRAGLAPDWWPRGSFMQYKFLQFVPIDSGFAFSSSRECWTLQL